MYIESDQSYLKIRIFCAIKNCRFLVLEQSSLFRAYVTEMNATSLSERIEKSNLITIGLGWSPSEAYRSF